MSAALLDRLKWLFDDPSRTYVSMVGETITPAHAVFAAACELAIANIVITACARSYSHVAQCTRFSQVLYLVLECFTLSRALPLLSSWSNRMAFCFCSVMVLLQFRTILRRSEWSLFRVADVINNEFTIQLQLPNTLQRFGKRIRKPEYSTATVAVPLVCGIAWYGIATLLVHRATEQRQQQQQETNPIDTKRVDESANRIPKRLSYIASAHTLLLIALQCL